MSCLHGAFTSVRCRQASPQKRRACWPETMPRSGSLWIEDGTDLIVTFRIVGILGFLVVDLGDRGGLRIEGLPDL